MSISISEPISPELALVSPELRSLAIRALPEMRVDAPIVSSEKGGARPNEPGRMAAALRICTSLILYACWQVFIGALFGLAAFVAFSAVLLGVAVIGY